jgi:hypothetical protein
MQPAMNMSLTAGGEPAETESGDHELQDNEPSDRIVRLQRTGGSPYELDSAPDVCSPLEEESKYLFYTHFVCIKMCWPIYRHGQRAAHCWDLGHLVGCNKKRMRSTTSAMLVHKEISE